MAIRKGKSDSPDIDDLMQDINQENQLSLEESRLEEKIAALKEATAALNAAADRADIINKGLNKAIDHLQTTELGATIRPDTLKALNEVCDNFVIDVGRQLMAHRDKQLEQQKAHEQRLMRLLAGRSGIWISDRWMKFLFGFLAVYSILIVLFVKFRG